MRGGLVELALTVERGREVGVAVRLVAACHEIRRCEGQPLLRGLERAREVLGGFGQTAGDAQRPTQVPVDQVQPTQRFLVGGARLELRFPDGERAALVVLRSHTVAGLERQQAGAVMGQSQQSKHLAVLRVLGQQPFPQAQRLGQVLDALPGLSRFVFEPTEPPIRRHQVTGGQAIALRTFGQGLADRDLLHLAVHVRGRRSNHPPDPVQIIGPKRPAMERHAVPLNCGRNVRRHHGDLRAGRQQPFQFRRCDGSAPDEKNSPAPQLEEDGIEGHATRRRSPARWHVRNPRARARFVPALPRARPSLRRSCSRCR